MLDQWVGGENSMVEAVTGSEEVGKQFEEFVASDVVVGNTAQVEYCLEGRN